MSQKNTLPLRYWKHETKVSKIRLNIELLHLDMDMRLIAHTYDPNYLIMSLQFPARFLIKNICITCWLECQAKGQPIAWVYHIHLTSSHTGLVKIIELSTASREYDSHICRPLSCHLAGTLSPITWLFLIEIWAEHFPPFTGPFEFFAVW